MKGVVRPTGLSGHRNPKLLVRPHYTQERIHSIKLSIPHELSAKFKSQRDIRQLKMQKNGQEIDEALGCAKPASVGLAARFQDLVEGLDLYKPWSYYNPAAFPQQHAGIRRSADAGLRRREAKVLFGARVMSEPQRDPYLGFDRGRPAGQARCTRLAMISRGRIRQEHLKAAFRYGQRLGVSPVDRHETTARPVRKTVLLARNP